MCFLFVFPLGAHDPNVQTTRVVTRVTSEDRGQEECSGIV